MTELDKLTKIDINKLYQEMQENEDNETKALDFVENLLLLVCSLEMAKSIEPQKGIILN